ncbi:MAG: hypothetical protein HY816_19650 [Candidatus Wallbacteria bacterium]|nr:hypothetical protein [Candidatus Wallbacteria bacterium]
MGPLNGATRRALLGSASRFALALLLLLAPRAPAAPRVLEAAVLCFPGLPSISAAEATSAAEAATQMARELLDLDVRIVVRAIVGAEAAFDRHVPPARRLDRTAPPTDQETRKMRAVLEAFLLRTPVRGIDALLPPGTASRWAEQVVERYLARNAALQRALGHDAMTSPRRALHCLGTWDRLMRAGHGWDLLVTNGPVLYAPQDGAALHALLRGGIIGGVTIWNIPSRTHGGAAMVSSYCLDSTEAGVAELRGRPPLAGKERVDALAALMTHELGHLLLKLPDNYRHANCLMHPPLGLAYLEWSRSARPPGCAECRPARRPVQSSSPSSTPSSSSSTPSPR